MVRSLTGLGLIWLAVAALDAGDTLAQTQTPGEPEVQADRSWRADQSRFRLFAERDFAVGGLRLAGDFDSCVGNGGNLNSENQCFNNNHPSPLFMPDWFDMFFYVAAPPSEWNKHQANVPSLANALGKGYTVNSALSELTGETLPHDGTLGPFHSGAQSTSDGTCQDLIQSGWASGNPMLAHSDCEITWGSQGWQGSPFVDEAGWLAYANQVGPAAFAFDAHRVPEDLAVQDKFLGNNVQTFGFFSDYSADALFGSSIHPSYGNVIPSGNPNEAPSRTGWPLGMLVKQDAFSFVGPNLNNATFVQYTVTNNSREVYGVGLDYDSIYMGLQPGWLTFEQGTSLYRDPANGVVRGATFCQTPTCGPGGDPQHPGDQWGSIPPNGVGTGFNYGAAAIIVLKSPIGDLRNKKLTDPTSPFFGLGDPEIWDDTITFNHGHMCGFHGCSAVLWNAEPAVTATSDYEQRQFGMVASITPDVLGDRALGAPADHTMWDTWRWEEFPDRNQLDFNRWTPGGWDYDGDNADDELAYDDCSGNSGPQLDPFTGNMKNCSASWSDTLPGGFGNVYANRGAVVGAGPFPLPADSTVEWLVAIVHGSQLTGTNVGIEDGITEVLAHYQRFFLLPEPPPTPTITSVDVQAGGDAPGPNEEPAASVTLYFDATAEDWEDPFLSAFLEDLRAAPEGTSLGNLRLLNPLLEDSIAALIPNNVAALHIFKSCDGAEVFTDDSNCFGDPATSGGLFGNIGWLPYATFEADEDGNLPNSFTDPAVIGGRTYLYSIVTESRGAEFVVQSGEALDTTATGEIVCIAGCSVSTLTVTPKLASPLSTAIGVPNLASVYVPVSQQAGSERATVTLVSGSPDFVPFERMNVQAINEDVLAGEYSLLFGTNVEVLQYATQVSPGNFEVDSTQVVFGDEAPGEPLTTTGVVAVDAPFADTLQTIDGETVRIRTFSFPDLTAVLVNANNEPLTVTSDLSGEGTVPGRFFGLPNFPGFTFSIDNTIGGSFDGQSYTAPDGEPVRPLVEPAITLRPELSSGVAAEGRYQVTWADQAFGPAAPFFLDLNNPEQTTDRIVQSLTDREVAQTASLDPEVASFVGLPVEQLVALKLPFRIENVTSGQPEQVIVLAPRSGKQTSLLLGVDETTLEVPVPEDVWIPGDELIILEGQAPDFEQTFGTAIFGCDPTQWIRLACNPVSLNSPGATGYITTDPGQVLNFSYHQTITGQTEYTFAVQSAVRGAAAMDDPARIRASLDSVKVVPNPFVMFSEYSRSGAEDRILFTHVPPEGVLRIFTIAGQFVQELRWGPENLNGRGDLGFNLRTREGNEMAAGLYLYVLTALDGGRELGTAKGKFVLIK